MEDNQPKLLQLWEKVAIKEIAELHPVSSSHMAVTTAK